jgi:hypothetical protein
VSLSLDPHACWRHEDVLASLFGFTGSGALRIVPDEGTVLACSRTYAESPDGTFGQSIPGVAESEALSGERALLLQVASSADPTVGFRTNVGLVNLAEEPIEVTLGVKRGSGETLAWQEVNVPSGSLRQLNDLLRTLGAGAVDAAYIEVSVPLAGRVVAFASVVDNRTGDPTFIPARRPE